MQAHDSKILQERLSELSEVYQAKSVSDKGLTVWFNILREFPTEKVCDILNAWPRSHNKMPTPNEVWKAVNDICIGLREKKSEMQNKEQPFAYASAGVSGEQAEKFLNKMREVLNSPKWTPLDHWKKTFRTQKPGSIGYEYAHKVLTMKGIVEKDSLERVPGEDDEQKAVNF